MEACVRIRRVDPKARALSSAAVGQPSGGGEGHEEEARGRRDRSSSQF